MVCFYELLLTYCDLNVGTYIISYFEIRDWRPYLRAWERWMQKMSFYFVSEIHVWTKNRGSSRPSTLDFLVRSLFMVGFYVLLLYCDDDSGTTWGYA